MYRSGSNPWSHKPNTVYPHPSQADYLFLSFHQAATSPHSKISCVQTPNSPYELFSCLSMAVALYKSQLHLVSVHKQRETSPDCLITTDLHRCLIQSLCCQEFIINHIGPCHTHYFYFSSITSYYRLQMQGCADLLFPSHWSR